MGGAPQATETAVPVADAGLLGNPLVNIGAGLLAASGPSLTPNNLGAGISQGLLLAQNAQQQSARNALIRQQLSAGAQRQAAVNELANLGPGETPSAGLLARVAPSAVAQGFASQLFPRQTAVGDIISRIQDPNTPPEIRSALVNRLGGDGGATPLQQAQLAEILQRTRDRAAETTRTQQTQTRQDQGTAANIRQNISRVQDIIRFNDVRRRALRGEVSIGDIANAQQGFENTASELITTGALNPFVTDQRLTDTARRQLGEAKIGRFTTPENADRQAAGILEGLLEAARINNVEIEGRQKILRDIKRLKGREQKDAERLSNQTQGAAQDTSDGGQRVFNVRPPVSQRRVGDLFNHPEFGPVEWTGRAWRQVTN